MSVSWKGAAARSAAFVFGAVAVAWALGVGPAAGQEAKSSLVEQLRGNGASVTALGRVGELDGWLVQQPGGKSYTLYVDGTGHAVMGVLFDREGASVTRMQLEGVRPSGVAASGAPAPVERVRRPPGNSRSPVLADAGRESAATERAATAVKALASSTTAGSADVLLDAALAVEGFDLGTSGPQAAVFADPTCFPSRLAVASLAKRALAGEIRLRVVPVGVRGGNAEALAAAVLGAPERALAWFEGGREGGDPQVSRDGAVAAAMNRSLFDRTGSEFVPLVLMREPGGAAVSAVGLDFEAWFGGGGG